MQSITSAYITLKCMFYLTEIFLLSKPTFKKKEENYILIKKKQIKQYRQCTFFYKNMNTYSQMCIYTHTHIHIYIYTTITFNECIAKDEKRIK